MYQILILPALAGIVAQICKFLINSNNLKINLKNFTAYSGMPSGHSAIVISLATIVGLVEGWNSSFFAITAILALIVIRDALGIRQYLGQHGKTLNILVKDLDDDNVLEQKYPHLLEKIGHTPAQVIAGSLIGFIISMAGFFILN
jgi:uncharacterized protein